MVVVTAEEEKEEEKKTSIHAVDCCLLFSTIMSCLFCCYCNRVCVCFCVCAFVFGACACVCVWFCLLSSLCVCVQSYGMKS